MYFFTAKYYFLACHKSIGTFVRLCKFKMQSDYLMKGMFSKNVFNHQSSFEHLKNVKGNMFTD